MKQIDPKGAFKGLPLSPEQQSEVRHYIKQREQLGLPWDTPELHAMLADMLESPEDDSLGVDSELESAQENHERAAAIVGDGMDPVSADEERHAASEAEAMKHPQH
ncbi:hypothetical protein [Massilia sp. BJB1822]|uniref:hypothetical protein n=1 Tax=Massilia sp. BJB1822 TaxID=2744470 RepID=UPI001593230A|nr:hypothetical protein [Massilia sp. BJB1822]NVE00652.1 hypothetical protein [Massilia sp. BJB1822]